MSEEIDFDASHLSTTEDEFEKFQSVSMFEEDEYVTLSDIVPPQPSVPDISQELNEIPYDNEVVLGSPQNEEGTGQVNTGLQLLDISENNVFERRLHTSGEGYQNDHIPRDLAISNSSPNHQNPYERKDLSSDGLGTQNYVIEDGASIIQDSLLSTTVGQSDAPFETPSKAADVSINSRRTRRGRIPNSVKYPMTTASDLDANKNTQVKRRPGRPKKGTFLPLVQPTFEADSTNVETSLLSENGSVTDSSGVDELTANPVLRKRRGRPKLPSKEVIAPTPSKRGRKLTKAIPLLANEELNNSQVNENTLVDSTKPEDVESQMDLDSSISNSDVNSSMLNTTKRKKRGPKKKVLEPAHETLDKNSDLDDDADDVCLSKLKKNFETEPNLNAETKLIDNFQDYGEAKLVDTIQNYSESKPNDSSISEEISGSNSKRNSKMPIMSDFEYNIDKVVKEATFDEPTNVPDENECLLVEDTSKRRRTAKKSFVYDEGSDEDPFANLESSDDEPKRRKKGVKYYSDDEYVPSGDDKKKGGRKIRSSSSESEDELDDLGIKKKTSSFGVSPFKKGRKPLGHKSVASTSAPTPLDTKSLVSTIEPKAEDDDIEVCLETTMIKVDDSLKPLAEAWAASNEFENFITQKIQSTSLKIKKVSSKEKTDTLAPLDIPVVDQNESKKLIESSTQTKKANVSSISVQTSAPYDIPMKTNIDLTAAQSEKACEFLSSVVKTTVELGQLMSQKSDDFMKKKINTEHVTDTFKMDYCVRKSFLLFKLAKHNLLQMEEDLANQYDAFLNENNLSSCREIPKIITPKAKVDSDSDCEIVEVVGASGSAVKKEKPKLNPKTVFLNKELSIKIAKKPSTPEKPLPGKKKLEIKGRHAVWINKNVMVKKVTPSQSFLAQDSRNKKPPDTYVTEKMVSEFFEGYNRKKALVTCALFINTDWACVRREYACHYFVNELDAASTSRNNDLSADATVKNETPGDNCNINEINNCGNPITLFSLCTKIILKYLHKKNNQAQATQKLTCNVTDGTDTKGPVTLFRLCINALRTDHLSKPDQNITQEENDTKEINNLLGLCDQNKTENIENIIEEINDWSNHHCLQDDEEGDFQVTGDSPIQKAVSPLTSICYKKIVKLFSEPAFYQETFPNLIPEMVSVDNNSYVDNYYNTDSDIVNQEDSDMYTIDDETDLYLNAHRKESKSLFSLCVELIQSLQGLSKTSVVKTKTIIHLNACEIKSLKSIAFESIKHILYPRHIGDISESIIVKNTNNYNDTNNDTETNENFTINCVNTMSEEAFKSLQEPVKIRIRKQSQDSTNFSDGFENNDYSDHNEMDFNADHEANDNGWATQLQMQEFRSCFTPHVNTTENIESVNNEMLHELAPRIKKEPVDDFAEENIVDTSIVKTEPLQVLNSLNEMTHIPDSIITKKELIEATNYRGGSPVIQGSVSYNVESFEQFVRSNKMIQSINESNDENEIFSQSGLRVRRQHEPDIDPEHDPNMSLLVPHTFEPLHLVEAKGSLMETSSDDDSGRSKRTGKKKDKRKKKNKKDSKTINSKETNIISKETPAVKDKIVAENEVAVLTRRMREKIRQEEKKIQSSDSDSEKLYLFSSKKDKSKKDKTGHEEKNIQSSGSDSETLYMLSSMKDSENKEGKKENYKINLPKTKHSKANKQKDDQVQCNSVDSTEKFGDIFKNKDSNENDQFSGFTAIDQNEITNYQKLMKFVYDKIIPSENEHNDINLPEDNTNEEVNDTGPVINPDEPVELLECEPTIPIFEDEPNKPGPKKSKNKIKKKIEIKKIELQFTERHGWHCYSIDPNDSKIYKDAQIVLEKLPESFVETYVEYQDVMDKDIDDQEVDRLINLQSLNRSINVKDLKDLKSKSRPKGISKGASTSEQNNGNISRSPSPTYSDNFDELVPSDDEGPKAEDEIPPPMPVRSSENHLAKNLLMDDHDSDSDSAGGKKIKIKEESKDFEIPVQSKMPGPKSRTKVDKVDSKSLMLTADKMMNKELNLLHAPIVLKNDADVKESIVKETSAKEESKSSKRSTTKQVRERVKNDDDSSSEEEKQWVSTKEKLLKRMGKKEDAIADETKRAKLVNEFIERRNESDRKNKRESCQGRRGRARRKLLERQKQLRFLSNELINEGTDGVTTGKRGAAAGLFKGRRNIRKVIDKKSLARSTVVANMEEFERKRRLNLRQNKLREVLGCEEGVNVLVINDEVCLEYDFVQQRPVVTVHQFFTKVMKAHQYEGVKFMWDACFESLRTIESGHGGGGCILAHCMGLGKTLQVLALLHTVLTHPRANMHRVLVCCPLSTVLNWVDEIHKWIGPVTHEIKVFELSKLRKTYERAYQLEDWYNGGGIFIIGYELFRSLTTLDPEIDEIRPTIINKIRTALLDPGPDIIVCDEGHLLKNDCSVLAVSMSRVVTKRRIVLTGTPMQNNLREYFCMVNFIKPNLLGTYSEYSNRFENPIMNGQHRDSVAEDIKLMKARTHILHKVLEGCLQRQEASVLYPYLPKKHEYTVFIPLTQCQWDLYNHYMDNYARTQKQKQILKDFHILQKIWSHPQVLHNFQMKARDKKDKIKAEKIEDDLAIADQEADIKPAETEVWWLQYLGEGAMLDSLDSSNKFVAVFRILHECVALGDKVLIFSTSLFCLDALEFFLKKINKWSLGQEYYRLDGSVPAEVRQKWCREFNADNNIMTKLFLISTRAGCLGLNMTAANRVIILDTSWNPAHDIQSIFRVYRFGQKKDCYIYRLVALGTMEQKIYERSVTKQAVACRVVDEQQIDRHYNLAELTELYSVDEMGLSVAGGVAVGVGDVALLRVARDAAIHAVHEHDSLLRGSGEQGLPEHERAAAWNQFQQEHEHKQMQNDLNANRAVVALKRLQMEHLRQQALYSAQSYVPPGPAFKTEPLPENYPYLVPKEEPSQKLRGRKPKEVKIVQCRIPIASGSQAGPSTAAADDYENQQDMVRKITSLLIKHNFMQNQSGPKQITELVAKVRKMVATGQPMALGPGYDELSSSIATVLLHKDKEIPMPALTDVAPPLVTIPETESRKRSRPKKSLIEIKEPEIPVPPIETPETGGRRRRKAALAAEMQFDSQQDVIDLDDDGDDWQNEDTDIIDDELILEPEPELVHEKKIPPEKPAQKRKAKEVDSSIVLSDDEPVASEVIAPAPPPVPTPSNSEDTEVIALHPSLLTNSNFIKIVAHTYLAGNPMMDEDAATLAAQYSTLKTLKEAESEGKPIQSGAVYDIAIQVLGKEVLKKLQAANPKTSSDSSIAANKLQSLLGGKSVEPETTTAPNIKKPKIGPKSKVMKDVKQEPKDSPQTESDTKTQRKNIQTTPKLVPVSKATLFGPSAASIVHPSSVPTQREESILPDEEVVITESAVDKKPIMLRRVKLERSSVAKMAPAAAMPVSMGRGPAPQAPLSDATICLDSDEEAPTPAPPPPRRRRIIRIPPMTPTLQAAPVPVALTGPNACPLPLPSPALSASGSSFQQPTFYKLSPCGTRAIPVMGSNPVPISMTGPSGTPQPVPLSLLGPGSQTMAFTHDPSVPISNNSLSGSQSFPLYSVSGNSQLGPVSFTDPSSQAISYSGQGQSQPVPISLTGPGSQPVPISLMGPDSQPMSLSGPGIQLSTVAYGAPASQPIPMSLVDSSGRPVAFAGAPMRSQNSGLTLRHSTHQTQASQQASTMPTGPDPAPNPALAHTTRVHRPTQNANAPVQNKTVCKPGDVFRISKMGLVEILNRKLGKTNSEDVVTHTIADDEPAPVPEVTKPAEVVTTPAPPPPGKSLKEASRRQTRRVSSSTSSSSGRSRSSSPDPLAILKDVVHIQAPDKQTPAQKPPASQKSVPPQKTTSKTWTAKPSNPTTTKTPKPSNSAGRKTDTKVKICDSVDLTDVYIGHGKSNSSKKQIGGSVDLTNVTNKTRQSTARNAAKDRTDSAKTSSSFIINTSKTASSSTTNKPAPSKLVGTSKSIILDGKSKSLKVDTKNTAYIQMTSSKKQVDKRPAPSTSAPAPKKKKTELMTLKDFDIDDIDDIIELE